VRGLEAAFIGTTDFSVDLGRPSMLDDARIRERVTEIALGAARGGVALGAWVPNARAALAARGAAPLRARRLGPSAPALWARRTPRGEALRGQLSPRGVDATTGAVLHL